MTRPTSAPCKASARPQFGATAGFTLVELLVVIGIIVLLVSILMPVVTRAYAKAERARVAAELNGIAAALEAYKQDHGFYPDPGDTTVANANVRGANVLFRALLSPGKAQFDGADGPGFRDHQGGKVWNPYLPADQFKVGDRNGNPLPTGSTSIDYTNLALNDYQQLFILDRFKKPVLYYKAQGTPNNINKPANPPAQPGFVASNPSNHAYYDSSQNSGLFKPGDIPGGEKGLRAMLGDLTNGTPVGPLGQINPNGWIDGDEAPAHTGPYLLWSGGPDEKYGPQPDDAGNTSSTSPLERADVEKCDDITNFRS